MVLQRTIFYFLFLYICNWEPWQYVRESEMVNAVMQDSLGEEHVCDGICIHRAYWKHY